MDTTKACAVCSQNKPLTDFSNDPRYRFGVRSECKVCMAIRERAYRARVSKADKPPIKMKRCSGCKLLRRVAIFTKCRSKSDGYSSHCKDCRRKNETPRRKEYAHLQGTYLWTHFRMRPADYNALYERQQGHCAICNDNKKRLNIDHDHDTGVVRGLLCYRCNSFLGRIERERLIPSIEAYVLFSMEKPTGFTATPYKLRQDARPRAFRP